MEAYSPIKSLSTWQWCQTYIHRHPHNEYVSQMEMQSSIHSDAKVQTRLHRTADAFTHSHLLGNSKLHEVSEPMIWIGSSRQVRDREEQRRKKGEIPNVNRRMHKKPMYKGNSEGKANAAMYFLSVIFHLRSLFALAAYVICCFVVCILFFLFVFSWIICCIKLVVGLYFMFTTWEVWV